MDTVHIGKLIASRLEELGMSKSEFARRIKVTSQNIAPMLKKSSMDTEQLAQISEVLSYDFFQHYRVKSNNILMEDIVSYKKPSGQNRLSICINITDAEKEEKILKILGWEIK